MEHFWDIALRTALAFALMMVIARTLGKTTISQMTYHDFVAAITLGALTSNLAFNTQMAAWQLIIALVIFAGIAYLLMHLALKNRKLRKWFSGQPTTLIEDGKILELNMRKLKFTLDTLNQELREKNIFNIEEVQFAVLELNGKISVLRKPEYQPVVRKDLNLPSTAQSFPVELIMDGKIIPTNLQQNDVTPEWLFAELKKRNLPLKNINYAVKSSNGNLYIDMYKDHIYHPIDRE